MEGVLMNIETVLHFSNKELLQAFYTHKIDEFVACPIKTNISIDYIEICNRICRLIREYTITEIISLIKEVHTDFSIEAKDVPQFSSLNDCYIRVPFLLRNCGMEYVSFEQMGYMLRTGKRNAVADKKYGENHAKTAAMLGLCKFVRGKGFALSVLGYCYTALADHEKHKCLGPLTAYIPFIQNCVVAPNPDEAVLEGISFLSQTTQARRLPNINTLMRGFNK
ncbi:MAG: hypothetical protein MJZ77_05605 [Bacteroidales bacterium]|nr:hypothetical protein [Bacteroidales bacterium]